MPKHQNPMSYSAPLRDMKFALRELLDGGELHQLPGYEDATPDLIDAILEEGRSFASTNSCPSTAMATSWAAPGTKVSSIRRRALSRLTSSSSTAAGRAFQFPPTRAARACPIQ